MRYLTPSFLALLAMALSGCSVTPPRSSPAPVSEVVGARSTRPAVKPPKPHSEGVRVYPYRAQSTGVAAPIPAAAEVATPTPWASAPLPGGTAERGIADDTSPTSPTAASQAPTTLAFLTQPPSMIKGSVPVKALLRQADAQRAAGDLVSAAATLERGVRIEPRNPYLWNRLARIRLEQGQFSQAESLAAKSNLLAGDLPALLGDNRRIIGEARRK